ncbi:MAG TPA: SurA N-terminal domain-containing protein [Xanthobacteraceae bacterium]
MQILLVISLFRSRFAGAVVLALLVASGWHTGAHAQVAALVNGDPITVLDVTHRMRLTEISTHKQQSREEALNDLINEKLKLQIARRYIINITDRDVDQTFAGMARHAGLNSQQFADQLSKAGIDVPALKARIKADIGWSAIIRGKFQGSLQVGEKEILDAAKARKKDDKPTPAAFQFKLRQVLLIVPRGSPESAYEARKKEAEALRARFQGCEEGVAAARTLRDVTVRDEITRSSLDVPAKQREVLDATPVGGLTPPGVTQLGVEVFAVCSKEPTKGDSPEEREVREEISNQRYEAQSKRYLEELRRSAMIEIR